MVERPTVLKSIDWVDLCYPEHLRNCKQKMQKDCWTSVAGCYEDFRSVAPSLWRHVAVGEKIILLIEPTLANLYLYYEWSANSNENPAFFADRVEQLVALKEGSTLMVLDPLRVRAIRFAGFWREIHVLRHPEQRAEGR